MNAILVDQVTAVYVVLAVSSAIFGGIFAFVWRLSRRARLPAKARAMALGAQLLMWAAVAVLAVTGVVGSVDTVLILSLGALLADWLIVFSCLWRLDKASKA
jgi:hypothetical protein